MQNKVLFLLVLATALSLMMIVPAMALIEPYGFWSHGGVSSVRFGGNRYYGEAEFEVDLNGEYFIWYMDGNISAGRIERYLLRDGLLIVRSTFESICDIDPGHCCCGLPEPLIGRSIRFVARFDIDSESGSLVASGPGFFYRGVINEFYFFDE